MSANNKGNVNLSKSGGPQVPAPKVPPEQAAPNLSKSTKGHSLFDLALSHLPKNFFEDILMLEMDLMNKFNLELLTKLIGKYSMAIEYYMEREPNKAKYYQNRMEFLLTDSETLSKLKYIKKVAGDEPKSEGKVTISDKLKKARYNVNLKFEDINFEEISRKRKNSILRKFERKKVEVNVKNVIKLEMDKQSSNFKKRLQMKKNKNNTVPQDKEFNVQDSPDKSKSERKVSNFDKPDMYEIKEEGEENKQEENKQEENKQENTKQEDNKQVEIKTSLTEEKKEEEIKKDEEPKKEGEEPKKEEEIKKDEEPKKEEEIKKEEEPKKEEEIKKEDEKKEEEITNTITEEKKDQPEEPEEEGQKVEVEAELLAEANKAMDNLKNLIATQLEEENENEGSESSHESNSLQHKIADIPAKFRGTYSESESRVNKYLSDFNVFFAQSIFGVFANKLKELYDKKYVEYIKAKDFYHSHVIELEFQKENDESLNEEQKNQIDQNIESLKEQMEHEIEKIENEYNEKIGEEVNKFKLSSLKNDSGVKLIDEQVKLDIYGKINEAFYN